MKKHVQHPTRAAERLRTTLKKYQPILSAGRARDVNESDTVVIITEWGRGTAARTPNRGELRVVGEPAQDRRIALLHCVSSWRRPRAFSAVEAYTAL